MSIIYLSPALDLEAGLKPLFSNEYILVFFKKFCDAIQSQIWRFKEARGAGCEAVG